MSNPIKPTFKSEVLPVVLILISIIASFYFYAYFPPIVVTHWNFVGQPDGWSSAGFAAFFLPILLIGMYFLFLAIPYLDPKKDRYEQFRKPYHIFKAIIIAVMIIIYFIASLNGIGYPLNVSLWVPSIIGLLFIVMGNYMSKIKSNWFIGIRTPWTLSSEEVWNKTHRLGGKIFIAGGLLMLTQGFLPSSWRLPVLIFIILLLTVGTFGYSYLAYLKENKQKKNDNQ